MLEFSCSAPCDASDTLVVVDERHTKRVGGVAQKRKAAFFLGRAVVAGRLGKPIPPCCEAFGLGRGRETIKW